MQLLLLEAQQLEQFRSVVQVMLLLMLMDIYLLLIVVIIVLLDQVQLVFDVLLHVQVVRVQLRVS